VARKPAGRFDSICINVFYALGLNEKFSGLKAFYLHICKPENASQARQFVACRMQWIQNHNSDDEESVRLKGIGELKQKWTTLMSEHTETFTLEDGGLEFHDIAFWDEQENGKLDRSQVVDRPFLWESRVRRVGSQRQGRSVPSSPQGLHLLQTSNSRR
jgi:hypothetical protein